MFRKYDEAYGRDATLAQATETEWLNQAILDLKDRSSVSDADGHWPGCHLNIEGAHLEHVTSVGNVHPGTARQYRSGLQAEGRLAAPSTCEARPQPPRSENFGTEFSPATSPRSLHVLQERAAALHMERQTVRRQGHAPHKDPLQLPKLDVHQDWQRDCEVELSHQWFPTPSRESETR